MHIGLYSILSCSLSFTPSCCSRSLARCPQTCMCRFTHVRCMYSHFLYVHEMHHRVCASAPKHSHLCIPVHVHSGLHMYLCSRAYSYLPVKYSASLHAHRHSYKTCEVRYAPTFAYIIIQLLVSSMQASMPCLHAYNYACKHECRCYYVSFIMPSHRPSYCCTATNPPHHRRHHQQHQYQVFHFGSATFSAETAALLLSMLLLVSTTASAAAFCGSLVCCSSLRRQKKYSDCRMEKSFGDFLMPVPISVFIVNLVIDPPIQITSAKCPSWTLNPEPFWV